MAEGKPGARGTSGEGEFWNLIRLSRSLRPRGWVGWALQTRSRSHRKTFSRDGRTWELSMTAGVSVPRASVAVKVSPVPPARPREWVSLSRSLFCKSLFQKMRQHRFLLVFGPEAGGSILFFKRIV